MNRATARRTVPGARVPDGWVRLTVPTVPDGMRHTSWRRTLNAVHPGQSGVDALPGHWLNPGDDVTLPASTLLLTADKTATGTAVDTRTRRPYTTEDAHLTVALVTPGGALTTLWTRHYARAASAFGQQVINRAGTLLTAHPSPGAPPVVLVEAQRPNRRAAPCRHNCGADVAPGGGHLVGAGRDAEVEHWPDCTTPAAPPVPRQRRTCDNCDGPGRGHEATDSSGIHGRVCARCAREPSYALSFA
ncbi:hypothetical protein [Streptomyces parvus]|uniref:hypothetical protein n=1 Tax=Streptomyces parvus TaxID=66428 RepID=UPI002100B8C2|nr:hypothetical protein [Streptomyces parvus]MCQ1577185.1 hypothetical protein [Streptomyces parvus]